ncbi:transposase [Fervidobacterium pennivorans]|uniref:transposase n=1 Tax=Fervidobacterium TaxID=2422 RepID=UPI00355C0B9F
MISRYPHQYQLLEKRAQCAYEVGDISRFSTYKKLLRFVGPSIAQSDKSKIEGHISKRGNALLRRTPRPMAVSE